MTGLQAIIALALFAPGVLAPSLGLGEAGVALFTGGCFATGMIGAFGGGFLVARWGAFGIAAFCMGAVMLAMLLAAAAPLLGAIMPAAMLLAGLILGLAFGPETPASSALLSRLARPEQRPLIFSLRQTGNQIGAVLGSLALPSLALADPRWGFLLVIVIAFLGLVAFLGLRRRYDALTRGVAGGVPLRGAMALLREEPRIARMALISMPYSAMQLALNAFFVSFLVGGLGVAHVQAGLLLGIAQAGGLIGRLGWGMVATWLGASLPLLAGLGMLMGLCALSLPLLPSNPPFVLAGGLALLFGLTASGWNGVFLAELARIAPPGRVAEATGAVLTASYAGLLAGPIIISGLAAISGLGLAYGLLGIGALLAGFWLMGTK